MKLFYGVSAVMLLLIGALIVMVLHDDAHTQREMAEQHCVQTQTIRVVPVVQYVYDAKGLVASTVLSYVSQHLYTCDEQERWY